ncbi:MAG TPA: preprotein translocase subunit SecE [Clostridiales bacterium]|nr:preprotein translocase subunit SecE [Clostridiales bacterium]
MHWLRSLPARVGRYLREVRTELRKVVWPDRRQTVVYTGVVVISVTIVAAMIWVVDTILSTGLSLLLFGA